MSRILVGSNDTPLSDFVIENFNPRTYQIIHISPEQRSIKIKSIKELRASLSTIPQKLRLVWIEKGESLTSASQGALLKMLEEPPAKTEFLITTTNLSSLLPTVRSRCTIKRLTPNALPVSSPHLSLIKEAISSSPGKRIILARKIGKERELALAWIREILLSLRSALEQSSSPRSLKTLHKILAPTLLCEKHLEANCHVLLTLENYLLSLPKTKT